MRRAALFSGVLFSLRLKRYFTASTIVTVELGNPAQRRLLLRARGCPLEPPNPPCGGALAARRTNAPGPFRIGGFFIFPRRVRCSAGGVRNGIDDDADAAWSLPLRAEFREIFPKTTRVDSRMTRPARFQCPRQPTTRTPCSPEQRVQRLQGQPGRRHGSKCDHKREMNDHIAPPSHRRHHRSDH